MAKPIEIPRHEHGVVRVFAINAGPGEMEHWSGGAAQTDGTAERALGAAALDWSHVEVVETEAVRALGLSTYLVDGLGLDEATVAPDIQRLDALSGLVLIVGSGAFGGTEQVLEPGPEVTLIGTYREPGVVPSFERLGSEGARGVLPPGMPEGAPPAPAPRPPVWLIVLAGLLAAAAVVLFLAGRG